MPWGGSLSPPTYRPPASRTVSRTTFAETSPSWVSVVWLPWMTRSCCSFPKYKKHAQITGALYRDINHLMTALRTVSSATNCHTQLLLLHEYHLVLLLSAMCFVLLLKDKREMSVNGINAHPTHRYSISLHMLLIEMSCHHVRFPPGSICICCRFYPQRSIYLLSKPCGHRQPTNDIHIYNT